MSFVSAGNFHITCSSARSNSRRASSSLCFNPTFISNASVRLLLTLTWCVAKDMVILILELCRLFGQLSKTAITCESLEHECSSRNIMKLGQISKSDADAWMG
ncbi:uncharacterized protein LOC119658729 [Hermetia illucens]|uniref:uncharacterized protein LOC119658729 n=1 Tax=Hermetia illucens TaxID=343691 RepID=UPI0018CBFD8D|nr:uncharacterized protein LOC119658729 [Hermetia illucens]